MNGSAFSTYAVAPSAEFNIVGGAAALAAFAVTDGAKKHFRCNCGTPIYNTNPAAYPGLAIVYLGSLNNLDQLAPSMNLYCESKLGWVDQLGEMPGVLAGPPARKQRA